MTSRRSFLLGLGATLAAPAIVRAEVLMPVRRLIVPSPLEALAAQGMLPCDGRLISRKIYGELYAVIGSLYGEGDGKDTFQLPNLFPNQIYHPAVPQGGYVPIVSVTPVIRSSGL